MTQLPRFLPWQHDAARAWLGVRDRFAHAWLIHGLAGTGKRQFALAAAASLLCEKPEQGLACGHCTACQWFSSGNHPDFRRIRPDAIALEEDGGEDPEAAAGTTAGKAPSAEIRVDQLRSLGTWFNTATHRGGWRVAVLYPAHALNTISANALLKVLEEPPDHTVFLIVADAPDRLLPTLVSRCRRLPLPVPARDDSIVWLEAEGVENPGEWLASAGGAPLLALRRARGSDAPCPEWLSRFLDALAAGGPPDVGPVTDLLDKTPAEDWLDALQRLYTDLALAAARAPLRYYPSLESPIRRVAEHASLARLAQAGRWLLEQRAYARHPLNARLLAHAVLDRAALACRPPA